jgi:hypothetical protein
VDTGASLCEQGQYGTEMYFLLSGMVELSVREMSAEEMSSIIRSMNDEAATTSLLMQMMALVAEPVVVGGGTTSRSSDGPQMQSMYSVELPEDEPEPRMMPVGLFTEGCHFGQVWNRLSTARARLLCCAASLHLSIPLTNTHARTHSLSLFVRCLVQCSWRYCCTLLARRP